MIKSLRCSVALAMILSLCLAATCAQAGAMPPGAVMLEVPETGGLFHIGDIMPLADGSVIVGGQVQYPGEYRIPYRSDYSNPRDKVRNDAIAMCIDPDGKVIWTIRLGDPQATNFLRPMGLLPDGRILMTFSADDSSFGSRFFIVGLDGVAEEMLPWKTLAAYFTPRSMSLMPESGYLGGDSSIVDDYYDFRTGRMEYPYSEDNRVMTLLDFDLNAVWQIDLSPLGAQIGNYNKMEIFDGFILLGTESTAGPDMTIGLAPAYTSVIKIDKKTGDILWQLTDEPRTNGMIGATSLVETPDGSMLFTGAYLAPGETLDEGEGLAALTKITPDGVPVWTKRYESMDIESMFDIIPFEDGYVMVGRRQNTLEEFTLLYVDMNGEPLGALYIDEEAGHVTDWPYLAAAPDGTVYIAGSIQTPYDRETGTRGDLIGSYLSVLKAEYFTMPERK